MQSDDHFHANTDAIQLIEMVHFAVQPGMLLNVLRVLVCVLIGTASLQTAEGAADTISYPCKY